MANANKIMQHECWAQMKTAKEAFATCPFCTDKQNREGKKDPERMLVVCQDCSPKDGNDGVEAKDAGSHGCTVCRSHVTKGAHISNLKDPKTGKFLCAACPLTSKLAVQLHASHGVPINRYLAIRAVQPHVILDRPQKAAGAQTIKIMGQHAENGEKQLTAASHRAHQTITQLQLRCEKLQANLTAARDKARRNGLAGEEEEEGDGAEAAAEADETAAEAQAELEQRLANSQLANEESQQRSDAAAEADDARAAAAARAEQEAASAAEVAAPAAEEEVAAPAAEEEGEVAAPAAGDKRKAGKSYRIKKKAKVVAVEEEAAEEDAPAAAEVAAPAAEAELEAELEEGEVAEVEAREVADGEPAGGAMEVEAGAVAEALAPEGEEGQEGSAVAEGSPGGGSMVGSTPPDDDSESEDEQPLTRRKGAASSSAAAKQAKPKGKGGKSGKAAGKKRASVIHDDSSSEEEERRPAKKGKGKKAAASSSAPAKQSRRAACAMPEDDVPAGADSDAEEEAAATTPAEPVEPQVDERVALTLATGVLKGRMPAYKAHRRGGGTNKQWLTDEAQRVQEQTEKERSEADKLANYDKMDSELTEAHAATAKARKDSDLQYKEVQKLKDMQRRTNDALEALMKWAVQEKGIDPAEVSAIVTPFENGDAVGSSE